MPSQAAERLEFRVTKQRANLLRAAARATGETLTDFVLSPAEQRAEEVLATRMTVSEDYFVALLEAMDRPPAALPKLADAAGRSSRRVIHK